MMESKVFDIYSRYYDLLYRDKDYPGEVEYITSVLGSHDITGGDILEFGSGTGKHGRLLAKKGYKVLGIERSPEMVALAEQTADFSCQQGDIRTIQLHRSYDAVLALFHVVSYQTTNRDVLAVLSQAAAHLASGGVFVFDFWYSPAVYTQRPEIRIRRMADEQIEITRLAEPVLHPNQNTVDVNYTVFAKHQAGESVQTMTESHPMRHFSLPEIDLLAQMTGFSVVSGEEFMTGKPPSLDTWAICVTLKKD
jgi:SAM-dependent methyltransferase